ERQKGSYQFSIEGRGTESKADIARCGGSGQRLREGRLYPRAPEASVAHASRICLLVEASISLTRSSSSWFACPAATNWIACCLAEAAQAERRGSNCCA